MKRSILSRHQAITAQDGAGVTLQRLFPVPGFNQVDPFLLLDHFGSDTPDEFIAGFPLHPHRGIETVTYMLEGRVRHKDSTGHSGTIQAGDVQWMSAGRGIMHEEMPEIADGKLDGFQLWLNLPAADKMQAAAYQEFPADSITQFNHGAHEVRLISGELLGHHGVIKPGPTRAIYADIKLNDGELRLSIPETHNAFVYVFEGSTGILSGQDKIESISTTELVVLTHGDEIVFSTDSEARLLLISGEPLDEPVARSGPFVMNTQAEIMQTWREIKDGSFPPD